MKLTDELKEKITHYLQYNVIFELMSLDLIYKTVHDLKNLIGNPDVTIAFMPYFEQEIGLWDSSGDRRRFDLCFIMPGVSETEKNIYHITVAAIKSLPTIEIKEV